jgi:DNA-directed RNA polymerase specialized sigma24 family protein
VDQGTEIDRLVVELDVLDSKYRKVIVSKVWEGLTFEQIAGALGCSQSSVHRWYQEGIQVLADKVKRNNHNEQS